MESKLLSIIGLTLLTLASYNTYAMERPFQIMNFTITNRLDSNYTVRESEYTTFGSPREYSLPAGSTITFTTKVSKSPDDPSRANKLLTFSGDPFLKLYIERDKDKLLLIDEYSFVSDFLGVIPQNIAEASIPASPEVDTSIILEKSVSEDRPANATMDITANLVEKRQALEKQRLEQISQSQKLEKLLQLQRR
jgi:hypothetical protein